MDLKMEFISIYTVQCAPTLAWVMFAMMIVALFAFTYMAIFSEDKGDKIYFSFFILLSFALFVCYNFVLFSSSKIRYEVRIDDTVSLQEVTKDWDIIEQKNDNIWVLERKDSNE